MKILLSGGGTAGHITPLLAVAQEIQAIDPEIQLEFIGQKGDKNASIAEVDVHIGKRTYIHAGKFRRFHSLTLWQNITNVKVNLLNLRDMFLIVIGFFESFIYLLMHRPDAIFFKGGFVVVPIGTAARLLRIPYMTHDSDPLPGLANRLIARGAKRNAVVSDSVRTYPSEKTLVSGIPLAPLYEDRRGSSQGEYKKKLGISSDRLLLFVYTGTQGAQVIDDALQEIIPRLLADYPQLEVNYVFGRLNEHTMNSRFQNLPDSSAKRLHIHTFITNAYDHIAAADVIIGRAGATSIAEFATVGRACIIIPAEQLTGGHQLMNAKVYEEQGAAYIVRQATMTQELEPRIRLLLDSKKTRDDLSKNIQHLAPKNAAYILASEIISIAKRSR